MKKLSRIAALLAAGAALLMVGAGFVSCSEDEEDTSPSISIKADSALTVAAGENFSVDATLTLKNDSFAGDIPQGTPLNIFIEEWIVTDQNDFADAPLVAATEDAAEGSKVLKINISGTAADVTSTKNGTIKIKLVADAVKSGKSLTTNAIKYQFTVAGGDSTVATAKTYSFAGGTNGIVLADLNGWDMATKDVIGAPIASEMTSKTLSNGATLYWKGSKVGTLRFRSTHDAGAELTSEIVAAATALNYNGGLAEGDLSSGVTLSSVDRYVKIPVDGAGTITASVVFKGGKDTDGITGGPFKAALVDSNGALIGSVTDGPVVGSTDATVTGTVSEAKDVYLVFSRNGAVKSDAKATGGLDVTSIVVAPAAN